MRVALKLMVLFVGLLVAVLAMDGWLRLRRERAVYERDAMHEQRLLGRALRPAVEATWRAEGREAAAEVLALAQAGESEVSLRLRRRDPSAQAVEVTREHAPGTLTTFVAIDAPDGASWAIELSESLAEPEARLRRGLVRTGWIALAALLGAAVLAVVFGEWIVGRPVRRLVEGAARIAQGDLSPLPAPPRRDEIGELKRAIATMVGGLANAREETERAREGQLEAERRLQRGERLVAIGTLAAGVAHELGTPLQVVAGRARMIERDAAAGPTARRHAAIISRQARHMERIVRELLGLARADGVRHETLSMRELATDTLETLRPLAEQGAVELALEPGPEGRVRGDREHLSQLLTNIVQNAIQAMEGSGSVRVRIEETSEAAPPPDEVTRPAERYVVATIRDDGPGISEEDQPRVFDPFFTTKDVGEGTGLGLAVAYGIAREHGGWIEARSARGEGAEFRVMIPQEQG